MSADSGSRMHMRSMSVCIAVVILAAVASDGTAQGGGAPPAAAQTVTPLPGPPIRVLGPAIATTTEPLVTVTQVRALPGGRVLVNESTRRRLLMLDSTMTVIKVVADSVSSAMNAYGLRPGKLLPWRGDSSILIDAGSFSMLVIDGDGNIVRVKAVPRADHATYYGGSVTSYGTPGFDAQGRLIYRINDPLGRLAVAPGGGIIRTGAPDSAPVLRLDFDTRTYDTVGNVRIQQRITEAVQSTQGFISMRTLSNPMPVLDDWAVTSDGAVAFLRHRDYSLDWLNPDGSRTSTPPMPFDWQRLTDDHKKAFVDSVRTLLEENRRRSLARYDSINFVCFKLEPIMPRDSAASTNPATRVPAAVSRGVSATATRVAAGGRGAPPAAATLPAGAAAAPAAAAPVNCPPSPYPVASMFSPPSVIPYTALPDYKPPFAMSSMRGDEDGNLWIRINQMRPVAGTWLYDIVNRQGELFDRIQMPIARTLVGYGSGNIVYTLSRTPEGVKLERVRWKP